MTAPHVGNTGMNDEDPESAPDLGRRLRRARPRPRPVAAGARTRVARRRAARPGRRRHLRHRHPRADPPPARARRDAGRHLHRPRPTRAALLDRVLELRRDGRRRRSPSEVTTDEAYVVPAVGEQAVHRRGGRPRHQGDDAAADGRARHRGARAAGHRDRSTTCCAVGARRGVLLQRPRRPGRPPSAQVELLRERARRAACPYFGICFGNQLLGRALGFGTYKLKYGHRGINQPVHGPHHRQGRGHRAQPRLRRRRAARRAPPRRRTARPTVSHVCLNDDVVEGLELRSTGGCAFSVQYHPEAAAGPHDAAYLFDRFVDLMHATRKVSA